MDAVVFRSILDYFKRSIIYVYIIYTIHIVSYFYRATVTGGKIGDESWKTQNGKSRESAARSSRVT